MRQSIIITELLKDLELTGRTIKETETILNDLRDHKWEVVEKLKAMGHDFTATTKGMDIVLSAPPSMKWMGDTFS